MAQKKRKNKNTRKRIVSALLIIIVLAVGGVFYYLSNNFNHLIAAKIDEIYKKSEVSSYYSLEYRKLRINLLSMSLRIFDVQFKPIIKNHEEYFKENGSLDLQIGKIILKNASLIEFIRSNKIDIDKFIIDQTKIVLNIPNKKFSPFAFARGERSKDSLLLYVRINHLWFRRTSLNQKGNYLYNVENKFKDFNLEIRRLLFNSKPGDVVFSFDELSSSMSKAELNNYRQAHFSLEKFDFGISNFLVENKKGRFSLHYDDFSVKLSKPKISTKSNVYDISAETVYIEEKKNLLRISNMKITPKLSKNNFARKFHYQTLRSDIDVKSVVLKQFDINKLINKREIYADTVFIRGLNAELFKDKRNPLNRHKFPNYLGKQIFDSPIQVNIKVTEVEDAKISFSLKQEDGRISSIDITKLHGRLKNIQNQNKHEKLYLEAKGRIHDVAPFSVNISFDYSRDVFHYNGRIYKTNLRQLSSVIGSFAPMVAVKGGTVKSIDFQGTATWSRNRGRMTFLYSDLNLEIKKKNSEKKDVSNVFYSFAANSILYSNNPVKDKPVRRVIYEVERDRNKGFIHILIQGLLKGLKETVAPSKENRRRYKSEKRK